MGTGQGTALTAMQIPIRGVLFDKDGTLIDFQKSWGPVMRSLALRFADGEEAEALRLMIAAGYDPATDTYRSGSVAAAGTSVDLCDLWRPGLAPDRRAATIAEIDAHFARGAIDHAAPVCPLDAVFSVLEAEGLVLGVATNDATLSAELCLEALGVRHRLFSVHGWDSVASAKPAPDMVHAFCAAADLLPAEVAVVGDNLHDLHMAAAAGAGLKIGVLSGNSRREHLERHADIVIEDISCLPAVLSDRRRLAG
ncbi:HAD family hydrolase [Rhodoligotrophos defluvii]|uniref:HAD family hydrolase n=1 Tax=Rhodoligotrophos defluvii TaxID=2561934 RepID=UPI0010C94872|nr:HAD family hydrolase [Rhodoligotrophos defluvii]